MAAPGSRDARYEQLAGTEEQRVELYVARTHLGFSIDEWLALPWWQRQVYAEGIEREAAQRAEEGSSGGGPVSGADMAETLLNGSLGDVSRTVGAQTG